MKIKKVPVGQYMLENLGDTDDAYEYIEGLIPWIGEIVVAFNGLESSLDSLLCETFSDRSDQKGLLVLHSMMYSTKVDLYKKFTEDFLRAFNWEIPIYKTLIPLLKECGDLRNKVVHANWEQTNNDGYTQIKYKLGANGLDHELCRFSAESLEMIFKKIHEARHALSDFEEECQARITEWNNDVANKNNIRNRSE
ncbi:hypothetical protein [Pseudomonas abyssi]|uniref:Uncharacterized protein n=1 Tax=Pseudomonas abyssi TaxID=170540 RepID=A0A395QZR2_9PSED|nr:hypothetical protein [Halopseudomonas gallaeciensis]RGP53348.1 hypothetical protein ASB58_15860 [Halopseudomonas gallaeciensis]